MKQNPNGTSKTPYEWAIEKEIRVTGLENHPEDEYLFYTKVCSEETANKIFYETPMDGVTVKEGKLHLKSEKYLELRMYTLVPYNLLGIQMGIQHEHSVVQNVVNNIIEKVLDGKQMDEKFKLWATEWKTSILVNGGTSNEGHMVRHGFRDVWYVGSMQQYREALKEAEINISEFYEPDLNSMLTGISFIVDERVFKRKLYKDYEVSGMDPTRQLTDDEYDSVNYKKWVEKIGGEKNKFLRKFLDPKGPLKLARG